MNIKENENKTKKNSPLKEKIYLKSLEKTLTKEELDKKYKIAYLKTNVSLFSHLYGAKDMKWRLILVILVGMIGGLISLFLVQNTGVYTFGLAGIIQGISRISKVVMLKESIDASLVNSIYSLLFYGLYIIINIPLLIFSWKKIGKKFTLLSLASIISTNLFPFILSWIPGIENIYLFGSVSPIDESLKNMYDKYGVFLLTFNPQDNATFVPMFIYTLISSLIQGICYSFTLTSNSSTGGTDIFSIYYSLNKNKSISSIILYFNIATVLISVFIGSFLAAGISDNNFSYERFFSQNLLLAIIYSLISYLVLNRLFPKSKLIKITIYSDKINTIREHLYTKNFNHSLTINNSIGGYSMQSKQNIEIVCFHMELPKLLHDIRTADSDSIITITPIVGIFGKMSIEKNID